MATRVACPNTVYIAVVYIAELDISRSHVGPHFFAHRFCEFCPRARYFLRNRGNSLHSIRGRQFARNLLTAIAFVPVRWRKFFAKSTRAYLSMRAGTHAVRWAAMLGGALTPSSIVSQSRVHLIQCQCKSRLQTTNLGINNTFS